MLYFLLARDCTEIIIYSFTIYALCIWLKTDKTKNILAYFLTYCSVTIAAWALEFPTLTPFLFSYAPIAIILLIVLHEKTLQRNLVTLKALTPLQPTPENWLDTLLGCALSIINTNKSITIVIENKDSLDYFLVTPFSINADLSKDILTILLTSSSYEEKKMVWITQHGQIKGMNAVWHAERSPEQTTIHTLFNKKDALFYTQQSDALIVHINPFQRTFTLITAGKEIPSITSNTIKATIQQHLSPSTTIKNKGAARESSSSEKTLF